MNPVNLVLFFVSVAVVATQVIVQVTHEPVYQPINGDIWGNIDGYKDMRLDTDLYRITYYCNDRDNASRYALYRAAELTLEKERDYFLVLDSNSQQSHTMQWHSEHIEFATIRML
jgi:hypothetical protein